MNIKDQIVGDGSYQFEALAAASQGAGASRRGFLLGLTAALATVAVPAIPPVGRIARTFAFTLPPRRSFGMTWDSLLDDLSSLFTQALEAAPHPHEHSAIVEAFERALWDVRPVGLKIDLSGVDLEAFRRNSTIVVSEHQIGIVKVKNS